jgi:hypothetical protein
VLLDRALCREGTLEEAYNEGQERHMPDADLLDRDNDSFSGHNGISNDIQLDLPDAPHSTPC